MAEAAEELFDAIEDYVARAVAPLTAEISILKSQLRSMPVPKDGIDGQPGRDGRDGSPGIQGLPGDRGADGRDGFSPDDLDVELKDGRTILFRLSNGPRFTERRLRLALPIYRGVFKSGAMYEQGDCVTYGGSAFVALVDTTKSPPGGDWQMAVKKGRDAS